MSLKLLLITLLIESFVVAQDQPLGLCDVTGREAAVGDLPVKVLAKLVITYHGPDLVSRETPDKQLEQSKCHVFPLIPDVGIPAAMWAGVVEPAADSSEAKNVIQVLRNLLTNPTRSGCFLVTGQMKLRKNGGGGSGFGYRGKLGLAIVIRGLAPVPCE